MGNQLPRCSVYFIYMVNSIDPEASNTDARIPRLWQADQSSPVPWLGMSAGPERAAEDWLGGGTDVPILQGPGGGRPCHPPPSSPGSGKKATSFEAAGTNGPAGAEEDPGALLEQVGQRWEQFRAGNGPSVRRNIYKTVEKHRSALLIQGVWNQKSCSWIPKFVGIIIMITSITLLFSCYVLCDSL